MKNVKTDEKLEKIVKDICKDSNLVGDLKYLYEDILKSPYPGEEFPKNIFPESFIKEFDKSKQPIIFLKNVKKQLSQKIVSEVLTDVEIPTIRLVNYYCFLTKQDCNNIFKKKNRENINIKKMKILFYIEPLLIETFGTYTMLENKKKIALTVNKLLKIL